MRMTKLLAACLAALFVVTAGGAAFAADFTTLGPHRQPAANNNPCKICHDTATADPRIRGWAGTGIGAGGWSAKQISYLCYMCHQGTPLYSAHNMSANAYDAGAHGYTKNNTLVPRGPEGTDFTGLDTITTSGLPYTNSGELECTTCHNVHVVTNRPFNQRADYQTLCDDCHPGRVNNASATNVSETGMTGHGGVWSTHPTRQTIADTARANLIAAASINASLRLPMGTTADGNYRLGGHIQGTDQLDCQTCHAVHGQYGPPAVTGINDLLAIDNSTVLGTSGSVLCEGCHYGGQAGQQVGSVAGMDQATLGAAGGYSDHPMDDLGNRAFYPTSVALPAFWTDTTDGDRVAQPLFAANGAPVCSSCHDMHGGLTDTPLLRGPQATGNYATVDYNIWCFACHTAAQVIPNNHHSNVNNMNTAAPLSDEFTSLVSCGGCHGSSGSANWRAHNGFWTWVGTAPAAGNSAFCQNCHTAQDPTAMLTYDGVDYSSGVNFPARHGVTRGTGVGSSHQTNLASQRVNGNMDYTPGWAALGGHASAVSEWGGGAGTEVPICESCHNILYNGLAAAQGLKQGWQANLLMAPYEDDGNSATGVETAAHDWYTNTAYNAASGAGQTDVGFCRACHNYTGAGWDDATPTANDFVHNPPAHTEYAYSYPAGQTPYGRATSTILNDETAACPDKTTADAASAPGANLSYPANGAVNCDSCHRPHNANVASLDAANSRYLILESTDAEWGSTICLECHDPYTQCN